MAFNGFGLQLGRSGIYDQASDLNLATHTYKSPIDSMGDITANGYFPPFLGSDADTVLFGDYMEILDKDFTAAIYQIGGVDPIVLTPTGAGSGNVIGPGSSTDNALVRWDGTSGELIKDSVVSMGDDGSIFLASSSSIYMGNGGELFVNHIDSTSLGANISLGGSNASQFRVVPISTLSGGVETNTIDSPNSNPISIAPVHASSVDIGTILNANGGVVLPTTGGTPANLNFYEELSVTLNFTGAFSGSTPAKLVKVGKLVTLTTDVLIQSATATNRLNGAPGDIPIRFAPSSVTGTAGIVVPGFGHSAGVDATIVFNIHVSAGSLIVDVFDTNFTNFTISTSSGFYQSSISWVTD